MFNWKMVFLIVFLVTGGCAGIDNSDTRNQSFDVIEPVQAQEVDQDKEPPLQREKPEEVNNGQLAKLYPETVFLSGPTTEKKIALTFDDGPDPRVTGSLLDLLKQESVPATFFLMGARVEAFPQLAKRMSDEGHSIGSHTYWHRPLIELTNDEAEVELQKTNTAIKQAIGKETTLFRPPFGSMNEEKVELMRDLGYSVIIWSVDSEDWKASPPDEIAKEVVDAVRPGSIILHHDGANWNTDLSGTVTAVEQEIKELKEMGYTFVTVPELLNLSGQPQ
ncbi:polysaccharide deacetylase family protein [Alkalicoccobacillus murimartini]|uniref:Peptidoglycan/xylan/chitin deacetylase (PgdA/CDA1 family) n=1 Tax=Alkalicoccobacillus murimartini TaxID=171685 RepID=A0ABT9YDJ8_9BACI|nr:polysaccharide deacetylase family protein [Alkalicoccobacillus murimartini]MDQ0205794.1 peptidoglycan/xylan/chitin deacetylase (PgdA/CDA1 family) [Alkalicoccobacillus murimartini]